MKIVTHAFTRGRTVHLERHAHELPYQLARQRRHACAVEPPGHRHVELTPGNDRPQRPEGAFELRTDRGRVTGQVENRRGFFSVEGERRELLEGNDSAGRVDAYNVSRGDGPNPLRRVA